MPLHFFTSSIHHCPTKSSGIFYVEMPHQAQQLNEAWEKRFHSLEQRLHGMVTPEAPQHNPGPLSAEPVAEDGTSHQDASGSSQHEGAYQSTTDEDSDDDDEDYVGD
ncbi:uncharacterized protein LOC120679119 [Panicum virgatum]|uniref:uncharacterized protein LOC120679119 n=1 Tax=Panicum virgatum TaxID=38727 RepID=UPI0019D63837|nr:uncharacterized protein LOC120679119 [Panicum virgatum]